MPLRRSVLSYLEDDAARFPDRLAVIDEHGSCTYEVLRHRAQRAGSALAAQRADEVGLLAPGLFADMVVLDPNPFALAPEDIQKSRVQAPSVGGRKVYEA